MKKILPILFLFLSFPMFAEFGIGTGLDLVMGINNLESDTAKINYFNYPVFPTNGNLNLFYFNSEQSKIGLLLDFDFQYSWIDSYKTVEYKGNENHHIVSDDLLFEKGDDNLYHKSKKKDPTSSFDIVLSPKIAYRLNDWRFSIGPTYTYSFAKMLFSDETDRLNFTNGSYGYSNRTAGFVNRQYIGANIAAKYKYLIIRTGVDFLENSCFTNNTFKNCFNFNLSVGFRKDWTFNTVKDRKIKKEDSLLNKNEVQKVELENVEKTKNENIIEEKKIVEETKPQTQIKKGNFSYTEIPFGATYEEIKELFKNEKVKIKESNNIEFQFNQVFNLGIMSELCEPYHQWGTGGVAGKPYSYESQLIGSYEYNYIKILEVYSDNYWKNLSSITFYFVDTGNNVFKLFLYEKNYFSEELTNTEFAVVMAKQNEQISTAINSNYINKEMKQYQKYASTDRVALCYTWKDKNKKLFLIGDTWKSNKETSVYRTMYYYDTSYEQIAKTQKKKYIEQKEKKESEKSQERINNSALDF